MVTTRRHLSHPRWVVSVQWEEEMEEEHDTFAVDARVERRPQPIALLVDTSILYVKC